MTQELLVSLPAAEIVSTAPTGAHAFAVALPMKRSQISNSGLASA